MIRRILGTLVLLAIGAMGGFMAAAALLRLTLGSRGDATSDELALVTIFDGVELSSHSTAFRGGSILTWFGGMSLDLRDATLAPDAELAVGTAFGGVLIRVPASWRIEAQGRPMLGGLDVPPPPDDPAAPVLTVRVSTFASGVSVSR